MKRPNTKPPLTEAQIFCRDGFKCKMCHRDMVVPMFIGEGDDRITVCFDCRKEHDRKTEIQQ